MCIQKKIFEINNKYYFEDWGLRNALIGINRYSVPDILENVVSLDPVQLSQIQGVKHIHLREFLTKNRFDIS